MSRKWPGPCKGLLAAGGRTEVPTKLQDILMGFIYVADELLKEAVGKSLLNRRRIQLQVLEPSRRAE